MISKKIKVFTLNRSCIEYFGKHCCEITYKRSLIVLHVYFFSLFPIAPLFSYRPPIAPFLLTAPLNIANAPWGAVAPTLETTGLTYKFICYGESSLNSVLKSIRLHPCIYTPYTYSIFIQFNQGFVFTT